jgi:hypothetical protein
MGEDLLYFLEVYTMNIYVRLTEGTTRNGFKVIPGQIAILSPTRQFPFDNDDRIYTDDDDWDSDDDHQDDDYDNDEEDEEDQQ